MFKKVYSLYSAFYPSLHFTLTYTHGFQITPFLVWAGIGCELYKKYVFPNKIGSPVLSILTNTFTLDKTTISPAFFDIFLSSCYALLETLPAC